MTQARWAWVFGLLLLSGAVACDESETLPPVEYVELACDTTSVAKHLHTKIDDDNGDGYLDDWGRDPRDEDDDIADHTWIQDDAGLWHLFFQNEGRTAASAIEHYTTTNFENLDYVGLAMEPVAGTWYGAGLWAPHVVLHDDTYYMFVTGVSGRTEFDSQRIGVATSTDLYDWEMIPVNRCGVIGSGCVYDCDESWTTVGDTAAFFNQQCRDPFVMRDEANDRWLMFVTAKSTNGYGVVTVASSSDLVEWSGAGYIDATRRLPGSDGANATGGQCENPFVAENGGYYYLFFADWWDPEDKWNVPDPATMTQYATSTSLTIDSLGSAEWRYQGYIPDPGVNAIEVIELRPGLDLMTQSVANGVTSGPVPYRRYLRVKCVDWDGEDFSLRNVTFPVRTR